MNVFESAQGLRDAGRQKLQIAEHMRHASLMILDCDDNPDLMQDFARHRLLLAAMYEEQVAQDNRWLEKAFSECPERGTLFHPAVKDDWKEFQAEAERLERIDKQLYQQCVDAGFFQPIGETELGEDPEEELS